MTTTVIPNLSAVAIGGRALLIGGPPGSGKTSLALSLIDRGAVLIGDDGIILTRYGDVIMAEPVPAIRGLIEVRNVGLVALPCTSAPAALHLHLAGDAPRFIDAAGTYDGGEMAVPSIAFAPGDAVQALRAEYALQIYGAGPSAQEPMIPDSTR